MHFYSKNHFQCIFIAKKSFSIHFYSKNNSHWIFIVKIIFYINNFLVGLSVISGRFLCRFLKCSFHFWSLSSWFNFKYILILLCLREFFWAFLSFCILVLIGFLLLSKDIFSYYFVYYNCHLALLWNYLGKYKSMFFFSLFWNFVFRCKSLFSW